MFLDNLNLILFFKIFPYLRVTEEAINETEKNLGDEKPLGEEVGADGNKESPTEPEEKEPEDKVSSLYKDRNICLL